MGYRVVIWDFETETGYPWKREYPDPEASIEEDKELRETVQHDHPETVDDPDGVWVHIRILDEQDRAAVTVRSWGGLGIEYDVCPYCLEEITYSRETRHTCPHCEGAIFWPNDDYDET